jgi:catechol 2,3-dioxygenase-like lactoylglutathione lyase family enzyme
MASKFTELTIDCSDPQRNAAFWTEVLGYDVTYEEERLDSKTLTPNEASETASRDSFPAGDAPA